jgi:hypothetical protein
MTEQTKTFRSALDKRRRRPLLDSVSFDALTDRAAAFPSPEQAVVTQSEIERFHTPSRDRIRGVACLQDTATPAKEIEPARVASTTDDDQ